jgi:hypothetical protein
MFTLGFLVGMVLSPFWLSVTLMMHRVKTKIPLKSKHDYRLKWWIPIKIAELLTTGSSPHFTGMENSLSSPRTFQSEVNGFEGMAVALISI